MENPFMKNNLFIDELKSEYIDAIYEIETLSFSLPWSKDSLIKEIDNKNAHYCVGILNGEVIGYIGLWEIIDEGHITNIAIHPKFRGHGFGKILLSEAINYCKNNNFFGITLEVRVSNTVAINLYESLGFVNCGIRKKFYTDNNEDGIIMWKYFR
ncbi:ribosomal protein S18-alanine N-acetyltransferase [Clostridium bornimense]|uniref:ribosomal protein S18-alanine N-acetyltransferase n=1 Tax=Clostridium bornimense TaxID=1216932 RepID=UPI00209D196F|nr:ribosomal protein S18-alanine N-acetyltransferase [Clostridium bornimense]